METKNIFQQNKHYLANFKPCNTPSREPDKITYTGKKFRVYEDEISDYFYYDEDLESEIAPEILEDNIETLGYLLCRYPIESSRYWYLENKIIRQSSHWGICGNSIFTFSGKEIELKYDDTLTGYCLNKHFKKLEISEKDKVISKIRYKNLSQEEKEKIKERKEYLKMRAEEEKQKVRKQKQKVREQKKEKILLIYSLKKNKDELNIIYKNCIDILELTLSSDDLQKNHHSVIAGIRNKYNILISNKNNGVFKKYCSLCWMEKTTIDVFKNGDRIDVFREIRDLIKKFNEKLGK